MNEKDIKKDNYIKWSNNSEGSNHKRKKQFHDELINLNEKFKYGCKTGSQMDQYKYNHRNYFDKRKSNFDQKFINLDEDGPLDNKMLMHGHKYNVTQCTDSVRNHF